MVQRKRNDEKPEKWKDKIVKAAAGYGLQLKIDPRFLRQDAKTPRRQEEKQIVLPWFSWRLGVLASWRYLKYS